MDYDELLRGVKGEMNQIRINLVKKAFDILDKDKNGQIELVDIKNVYSAKNHPDVKSGKKTEDEVLMEFLDTFEQHAILANIGVRDSKVNWNEFKE